VIKVIFAMIISINQPPTIWQLAFLLSWEMPKHK
jgi:hypothetical protein